MNEIPLRPVHLALWAATVEKVEPLTAKINAEVGEAVREVALDLGVPEADLPRVQLDAKRNGGMTDMRARIWVSFRMRPYETGRTLPALNHELLHVATGDANAGH